MHFIFKKERIITSVITTHTYRPDIDGLRAIAVMMVIGFHAFPSIFKGGFVGVDIFFIISGYLISSILIKSLSQGTYSLLDFYNRRVIRIFPALITVLLFCIVTGWYVFTASEFKQLGKHVASGAAFISNIVYMYESGYFDMSAETKPLLHLWSLGVEEQFYILLPLLLWAIWKIKARPFLIILLVMLASLLITLFLTNNPNIKFYSPQNRFWELLFGTLLALYEHQNFKKNILSTVIYKVKSLSKHYANIFSFIALSGIFSSIYLINNQKTIPGVWTLLPTVCAVILIAIGNRGWVNRTILSKRLLVWIGLISYPLYLWHWPLLVIATLIEGTRPSVPHRLIALVLTFVLSICTYFLIEKQIRFGRYKQIKSILLAISMFIVGAGGYAIYLANGFPEREFAQQYKNVSEAVEDWESGREFIDSKYLGQTVMVNTLQEPEILFIGDSHVEQFMPRVAKLTKEKEFPPSVFLIGGGCPPIPFVHEDSLNRCEDTLKSILTITENTKSIKKIVIGGCWNCYFLHETKNLDSSEKGFNYFLSREGTREYFRNGNGAAIAILELEHFLKLLSKKFEVYLLLDSPFGAEFNPKQMMGNRLNFQVTRNLSERVKLKNEQVELNNQLKNIALNAGVKTIDQISALCNDDGCLRLAQGNKPIYKDDHHLRPFFVKEMADYFERALLD